jgi:hypothetical protein
MLSVCGQAARYGQTEAVALLLDHGFDPAGTFPQCSPLRAAVEEGHVGVVQLLLRFSKLELAERGDLLALACSEGHAECFRFLWDKSATPEESGLQPAIIGAMKGGHWEIATELLIYGVHVDQKMYELAGMEDAQLIEAARSRQRQLSDAASFKADLSKLLSSDAYDITFVFPNGERLGGHRGILATRCEKFRAMFLGSSACPASGFIEARTPEIFVEHYQPRVFRLFLRSV